jgi:hypothetical protein
MSKYGFVPFQGPLEELSGPELLVLKETPEGWYIDYKESDIKSKDYGKHISSFANQYGGWLFIGVRESKDNTADSFPGIPRSGVDAVLSRIREGATTHVSNEVYYETKIIDGPVDEIGLPSGQVIVVIGIPEGSDPPYVHSSGRIFRRLSDKSEPSAETDRSVLDRLFERGEKKRAQLKDFLLNTPYISDEEARAPRAYLYLVTNPHLEGDVLSLSFQDFHKIMISQASFVGIEMHNFFQTVNSYIARATKGNNPDRELLTFRWWNSGDARFSIPFSWIGMKDFHMQNYADQQKRQFCENLRDFGFDEVMIMDVTYFLAASIALSEKFLAIYDSLGLKRRVLGKLYFRNVARCVPYLPFDPYIETIKDFGAPLGQDQEFFCPRGTSLESFLELKIPDNSDTYRASTFVLPLLLMGLMDLGIQIDFEEPDFMSHLFQTITAVGKEA